MKANGKPPRHRATQQTALASPSAAAVAAERAALEKLATQPPSEFGATLAIGCQIGLRNELGVRFGKVRLEPDLSELAPRDPLERMLIEQLVCCHERILRLTCRSGTAARLEDALAIDEQCDRTMNAYRRGMLALKEYRTARREAPLVAIQQVNHQITPAERVDAAGHEPGGGRNMTNELGAN